MTQQVQAGEAAVRINVVVAGGPRRAVSAVGHRGGNTGIEQVPGVGIEHTGAFCDIPALMNGGEINAIAESMGTTVIHSARSSVALSGEPSTQVASTDTSGG